MTTTYSNNNDYSTIGNVVYDSDVSVTGVALPKITPVVSAAGVTAVILAACHSLVVVDDGDVQGAPKR